MEALSAHHYNRARLHTPVQIARPQPDKQRLQSPELAALVPHRTAGLFKLVNLTELDLDANFIALLPPAVSRLSALRVLRLDEALDPDADGPLPWRALFSLRWAVWGPCGTGTAAAVVLRHTPVKLHSDAWDALSGPYGGA